MIVNNRDPFLGDVGTLISIDVQQDISTATEVSIKFKKPNGTTGSWPAYLEGLGAVQYITVQGDLDQVGTWYLQAYVNMPTWRGHSSILSMTVRRPLTS